jgi:hypothetical protein
MILESFLVVLLVYVAVVAIMPFQIKQPMFDQNYLGKPKMKRPQGFGY